MELFRRRHLPHWDVPGATYFITTCLWGSIPAQGLLDLERYEASLDNRLRPANLSEQVWVMNRWKLLFARMDQWLDRSPAVRQLVHAGLARIIETSFYHFAGHRYDLLAYVVMPSHVHWVFTPRESWVNQLGLAVNDRSPRERIMHSFKRFTGRECNKQLRTQGAFWQPESFDHWVRDTDELERIIHYVEWNPVKAGLTIRPEQWEFSSAYARKLTRIELGMPLLRSKNAMGSPNTVRLET
jgi:type I restriction enzyme R subunit